MKVKKENISLENYESWLLDYLEGNLSVAEMRQVKLFLLEHPGIQEEFALLSEAVAVPQVSEKLPESLKLSLQKPEILSEEEISWEDELSVKVLEKDANPQEIRIFNRLKREDSDFKRKAEIFQKLKLTADSAVIFEPKSGLKRYTLVPLSRSTVMQLSSIAATLAVLLFAADLFFDYRPVETHYVLQHSENDKQTIAESSEKIESTDYVAFHQEKSGEKTSVQSQTTSHIRNQHPSGELQSLTTLKENQLAVLTDNREAVAGILPAAAPVLAYFAGDIRVDEEPVTLKSYLINRFKKDVLGEPVAMTENSNLKVYEIADAGLGQLSKISNNRFSWKGERDEKGSLVTYSFKTPFFEISKEKE